MIGIISEAFIHEQGRIENQEDALAFTSGKLYILCDGLGGQGYGNIASQLVSHTFKSTLDKNHTIHLNTIVQEAEENLSQFKKTNPKTHTMASTVALTRILENTIEIGWIGDTCVYQIRSGKFIFKTIPHTWVEEAIQRGELSENDRYFHPNKSQLTRCIKDRNTKAQLESINCSNLVDHDWFLLCTDGIQEAWIDSDLETLFSKNKTAIEILEEVKKQCHVFSTDNYSAILFQIKLSC